MTEKDCLLGNVGSFEHRLLLDINYKSSLELYFHNLSAKIEKTTKLQIPEVVDKTKQNILDILYRNTLMAEILESKDFLEILEQEKQLRGEVKVGVVQCIDGRLSIPHQFGRATNVKEIAGSLIKLNEDGETISDRRFEGILEQTANEGRELLQIVTGHTSLKDEDHRCGRIMKGVKEKEFTGEVNQVAWEEAEKRAIAIENEYNDILQAKGKTPQAKVAITAMIDTDTMGLIFSFGQANSLSTTELTRELTTEIQQALGEETGGFGSMKDTFADPFHFIEYSEHVLKITEFLTKRLATDSKFKQYITVNFPELTSGQKQALLFTIGRTIANQYITGLASEEEFTHPYLLHSEEYMVVSPHGKPLGGFDLRQSFGSVPADRGEMLIHVLTKLSLLDKQKAEKPYILFFSTPVNKVVYDHQDITLVGVEDAAKVYFLELFKDEEIKKRVYEGSLVIIPILIDESNRRPLEIRDYSIFLN
ncbi:hypothetical protein A3C98_04620 [Candidatus Roizmanbacteria bacterium RIFCSPHIGHO2_02_FULL_37_15]|uniref:Uncharacterized protein n=1 Tax=Candidatus Roizmanbacteria bacterium RIFCSPLOWO2_01_FULL_37_16 TaxID=1802058 RepID=A0A1F7IMC9_9BACT|nr:MAG: hypothetical protein A2859_01845 [Candidatus Roizmanbacteria bacterium RIFCSPHIGHO2_01_FULL_37_16b]OGK22326.1 MAG: hypothetical protein A3C98_04620 [Candidatus Roizmanbacteria bacterium RIFCSPHIGHO2_02_FULL_37_15]OGK44492.1 MAG: hypothetical protein A3B40_01750 [Candidatus Roizmanbacteria bacterium RIFCSPLOWO2_01_FULL_37_16]OGK57606.1 MAG: hypothetical protein A3I50_05525 [Candidatus Roizmanbacteria bacterium RIFCSPLOWO2_02_FULL_37_9]